MKRIPLILAVLIAAISVIIITIFLIIPLGAIWLLGGYKPFTIIGNLIDNFNDAVFKF